MSHPPDVFSASDIKTGQILLGKLRIYWRSSHLAISGNDACWILGFIPKTTCIFHVLW